MIPALLDVNVLLALAWPNHQHHAAAHHWFAREARHRWATIAFTQLGFIRLSSNPAYTTNAVRPGDAALLLCQVTANKHHVYWQSIPAANADVYTQSVGHQQVNDAYLIAVARHHHGRLVTFDQRMKAHAHGSGVIHVLQPN